MRRYVIILRKVIAVLALLALAGLIVTLERGAFGVNPRLVVATRVLLVPLGITVIGLVFDRYWGRWLALATAVLLLVTLLGRDMVERYEGRAPTDWRGPRMA